ncbi:MAG: acyltransferase [Myxococcota bacterium]
MSLDSSVFVHEKAICESESIGPGSKIWAFAHILPGAVVGSDCNISNHVFIESDCQIGNRVVLKVGVQVYDRVVLEDEVFVGPGTVFSNDPAPRVAHRTDPKDWLPTLVRRGASLGAGVTVVCGVVVDEYAFVGAGSVVTRDVPAHALVVGNPARRLGWVCVCGQRLDDGLRCGCGREFTHQEEKQGLQLK